MKQKLQCLPAIVHAVQKKFVFLIISLVMALPLVSQAHWVPVTGLQVGNIISVAFDPGNSANIFAGTDVQDIPSTTGLYRSIDAIETWNQITATSLTGRAIRSISISPDNTATLQKMFIAVAEQGIFRSTNNGNSWIPTQIEYPVNSRMYLTQNVTQVIVARQQGTTQKVYAVVSNDEDGNPNSAGIYMTTDNGANWTLVYQSDDVKKLLVHPNQPNTLYMATVTSGELLKSINGGTTFAAANSGLPTGGAIVNIAVDPDDGSRVYASVFSSGVSGFYRSINGGTSWTKTNDLIFAHIAVSSSDAVEGRLYAIRNESPVGGIQYSVFQSADDGVTWARVSNDNDGIPPETTLSTITVDQEVVYVGGDSGLYKYDHNAGSITDPTQADLSLSVSATPVSPQFNENLTYTLVVENLSNTRDASNVLVTSEALPAGMRLVAAGSSSECSYDTSTNRISCSANSVLKVDGVTFTVILRLPATVAGNQINARFAVTSDNDDILDNNIDQVNTVIDDGSSTDLVASNSAMVVNVGSTSVSDTLKASSSVHTSVTYIITNNPSKGSIEFANGDIGQSNIPNITYTPNQGQSGTDSFAFMIRSPDGHESNVATVTVSIKGTVENPTGQEDATTSKGVGSGSLHPLLMVLFLIFMLRRRLFA